MKVNSKKQKVLRHIKENFVAYLILGIFTVIFAYPILWSFISSFKTSAEIRQSPFSLPAVPQFRLPRCC